MVERREEVERWIWCKPYHKFSRHALHAGRIVLHTAPGWRSPYISWYQPSWVKDIPSSTVNGMRHPRGRDRAKVTMCRCANTPWQQLVQAVHLAPRLLRAVRAKWDIGLKSTPSSVVVTGEVLLSIDQERNDLCRVCPLPPL